MLNQFENTQQILGGSHQAIDNWLEERKQLLVEYCQLAGLPPFERSKGALPGKDEIEAFCELLVDYMSAGHFEVYDKLPQANQPLANSLYPQISATTEHALSFHDSYAEITNEQQLNEFDRQLSQLGQQLEERFALEDKLMQSLSDTTLSS